MDVTATQSTSSVSGWALVRGGPLVAVFAMVLGTLALVLVAAVLLWQVRHSFMTPIYDDIFDRLRLYDSLSKRTNFLRYLIAGHNEHRITTTRLVALIDELCFSGREYTQVVATNALLLISAFVAWRYAFAANAARDLYSVRTFLFGSLLLLLLVNPNFFYTLIVPFQIQHAIMTLLVVISALVTSWLSEPDRSGRTARRSIIALIALAVVASFTLDNAPAILLAAAAASVVMRCRRRLVMLLSGLATVHTLAILLTTHFVGATASPTVLQMIKFALVYWGAPFHRLDSWPSGYVTWAGGGPVGIYAAAAFGGIVLATAMIFALFRLAKPGLGGRLAMFGLVLLMVVIATGCAAAHSRAQFGLLEGANKKYASFAALGWLGVVAVATGIVDQLSQSRKSDWPAVALLLLLVPVSADGYARETRIWQKMIDRTTEASLAVFMQAGVTTQLHSLYTDENELLRYIRLVEPRDRGLYSHYPFRWGDDSAGVLTSRRATHCRGGAERLARITPNDLTDVFHSSGAPYVIAGWAWMDEAQAPPALVIATDDASKIVGVARITRSSDAAEEWLGQKLDRNVGWFGYARFDAPPTLTFFGLSADGSRFCRLSGLGETP